MSDNKSTTDLNPKPCRIGGASGFWGDSSMAAPQLLKLGNVDYIVFDYLAELTMSILAAQRMKNPEAGYALDFVAVTCKQVLAEAKSRGIKLISNAGGVNPQACAKAVRELAASLGVDVKVAVVTGDDVLAQASAMREAGVCDLITGKALPEKLLTANAYLGAWPIKAALDAGADVVITGRCVDSAVTLGALLHHFGWQAHEQDKLAQASLAGHIIECGAQGSGGLFTDWEDVPDWANIGYPIVEVSADASFIVTKPPHTGGLVNRAVVAEQLLYEIHDPAAYMLPDVVCDFTQVQIEDVGEHQVRVTGARGLGAPEQLKVSATHADGFKAVVQLAIIGFDAAAKARRTGEALLERTSCMLKLLGLPPYSATHIEVLGAENAYGPHASVGAVREAILRLAVRHPVKAALELFAREIASPGTSFSPGTTGMDGGRPSVNPCVVQVQWLMDRGLVQPQVDVDGAPLALAQPAAPSWRGASQPVRAEPVEASRTAPPVRAELVEASRTALPVRAEPVEAHAPVPTHSARTQRDDSTDGITVPLIQIAHARSGDKGNTSNIGVIARHPDFLPIIESQVTPEAVKAYLAHFVQGEVTRHALPGIQAFNFVCTQALGGGGMASLRHDPLGKGMAQILLGMPVQVPASLSHLFKKYSKEVNKY